MQIKDKKGNIPATLLTILSFVLFIMALAVFTFIDIDFGADLKKGFSNVEQYNLKANENEFLDINEDVFVRTGYIEYFGIRDRFGVFGGFEGAVLPKVRNFGNVVVEVSVTKILNG
jgi:hypothetical protein